MIVVTPNVPPPPARLAPTPFSNIVLPTPALRAEAPADP